MIITVKKKTEKRKHTEGFRFTVTSGGLGPPTHSLEDCCSIQLRYEAIKENDHRTVSVSTLNLKRFPQVLADSGGAYITTCYCATKNCS